MIKRKFTEDDRASALAALRANNGNVEKTAKMLGISRSTLRGWADEKVATDPALVSEKCDALAEKLGDIANTLTDHITDPEKIKKANIQQITTAAAICIDKRQLLKGNPTKITATVTEKRKYEAALAHLIAGAKKEGITVEREEAIELLSISVPDIKEVLGVH